MKKIKFKVYDFDTNIMYEQEDLIITFDYVGDNVYVKRNNTVELLYRYKLLQYIGINDKDGKEIYNGDIIKRKDLTPISKIYGEEETGIVEYNGAQFVLKMTDGSYHDISSCRNVFGVMAEYKVIGNIYE